MAGPSNIAENGSCSSHDSNNKYASFSHTLADHHGYPQISWMTESWLAKLVRYELIGTASPRIGMALIGTGLIDHHVNLIPTLHSAADFLYVHDSRGRTVGVRPKMATWPLSQQEVLNHKEWAA